MLLSFLLIFTILYAIQICIFALGAHRAHYACDLTYTPSVSVIIAARNEEANIRACLESVSKLTYPKELLEVIVVNDRSTDATQGIIEEFTTWHSFITLVNAVEDPNGKLKGKTNAIAQGVDVARGKIILFTDADCIVPERWVEETVKYYSEENVGLVAGFTSLRATNIFEGIQALDWFVLFSIAAATIRLHFPVTAVGNNLSVRRKAYDAVGGYRTIPFSVTEDYALFNAITSPKSWKAKFPIDAGTLVHSLPCGSWAELFRQKKRWFTGGAEMNLKSIMLFATGFVFKALLSLNLVFSGLTVVLIPLLVKCSADYLLVRPALSTFKKSNLLKYFLPFELYYICYVVLFPPLVLLNRNVKWKEREFSSN
jgi:cellulose synthase/poly-beta-1,6-N-acetylglucosamine synthase-like glycosyltransferase